MTISLDQNHLRTKCTGTQRETTWCNNNHHHGKHQTGLLAAVEADRPTKTISTGTV